MALLSTDPLDIRLDEDDDLFVGPNGAELIGGIDGVAQLIRIAIRLFLGEWFANRAVGVDWDSILGEKFDEPKMRADLSAEIETVPGVDSILTLAIAFDGTTREVSVTGDVRVKFDDTDPETISISVSVGGGNG